MAAHSEDLVTLEELRSVLGRYAGPENPRERSPQRRSRRLRPLIAAAVVAVAAVGAGLAIAAGLGAFNGISAAQHPRTGADVLDAKTLARLQNACPAGNRRPFYVPFCHLVLASSRLIAELPSIGKVYIVADTRGDLCSVLEGGESSCGPPLSKSHPISFGSFNPSPTTGGAFVASGLAMDGVTAVSFTVDGKPVTAAVKDNAWAYERPDSHAKGARCIVAHL